MATRVRDFGRRVVDYGESKPDVEATANVHKAAFVDKAILNEAVETTLENAEPRHADSMRRLWATDQDSDAARAYFADQVRQRVQSKFAEVCRKEHVVNEVLNQEESAKVAQYAREFALVFRNSVGNEHGFFSARRGIDHQILMSKFPPTMPYLDFGGSVQYHARAGNHRAITVGPFDLDVKDATRATLTRLSLRRLAADGAVGDASREIARSVLAGEPTYYVPDTVQTCTVRAPVSVAVHVYDVPLPDWPHMMERCGVRVHEGCMHFVNDFFEQDQGEFEFSGARYEIDRENDLFRMRVGRGSSMWYTHKWSDYMRYGANQILHTDTARYSYQIVERRQDTIFYRILRVDSHTMVDRDQVYALPSRPMVEVAGFEIFPDAKPAGLGSRKQMVRRKYMFPQALWERMLTYATDELDRGGLSYDKMFNYYRTVVPRQTINSVHVSGGQKVPLVEVPALIVMAGVVAYADAILMQRTVRARTDQIQAERRLRDESTLFKGFRVFVDALVAAGFLLFSPFQAASEKLTDIMVYTMKEKLVTWKPQVRLRSLNVALIVDHKSLGYSVRMPDQLLNAAVVERDAIGDMVSMSAADPEIARVLLNMCGDKMTDKVRTRLEASVGTETLVGTSVTGDSSDVKDKPGVTWLQKGDKRVRRTVYPLPSTATLVMERRLAVQEALAECLAESKALRFTCERISRDVLVSGKPNEHVMRARREELYNPDLWYVSNGVLVESVLNPKSAKFSYSGVYLPTYEHERLQPVHEEGYEGAESASGKAVARSHFVLPFKYTGFALVIDGLKIFNGPAVAESLSRVLEMGDEHFLFDLVCHQGPPGCGKTTTVARDGDPNKDVFLAPTRIAQQGLAERLRANHGIGARKVWTICRTLDSLLVNYARLPDDAKQGFDSLLIDEYVLARSGKWIAAAVLLGVTHMHAYGDSKQITHKPRVQVPKLFLDLKPHILEEEFVGYRNPAVILAAYNFVYDNEVRTASDVVGRVVRVRKFAEVQWMKSCRLMSMYQADKKLLGETAQHAAQGDGKPLVSTVHEAQGSDCDQVVLYNGEYRKREAGDAFYLYGLLDYCLVAMSRARKEFVYVKMSDEADVITRMIANSTDVRRVEAARDVSTQGQSNFVG